MGSGASKAGSALNAKLQTLSGASLLKTEWRAMSWDEETRSNLIEAIKEYKPLSQVGVEHARILLLGPVNVGKSSYFNTINSIFRNHVTAQAPVGAPLDDASITTKLRGYQIRNGREGRVLNFRVVDTMGIEEGRKQGFDPSELPYILDGHVPENHQFDSKGNISREMPGYINLPKLSDRIHCCVIALDANTVNKLGEGLLTKISDMRGKITSRGIPIIVLLTKIDKACAQTAGNVSLVYRSSAIRKIVDQTSIKLGVPVSFILPMKNYTHELELDPWVDVLALSALQQMLRFTDNYFDECLSTTNTGYVQPDKPSRDLWTQSATLQSAFQSEKVKQAWSPNRATMTPTAFVERVPNSLNGSMRHRKRFVAGEEIRASPLISMVDSPTRQVTVIEVKEGTAKEQTTPVEELTNEDVTTPKEHEERAIEAAATPEKGGETAAESVATPDEAEVNEPTAEDVTEILADDNDVSKLKKTVKQIEGFPLPGAVAQEAA